MVAKSDLALQLTWEAGRSVVGWVTTSESSTYYTCAAFMKYANSGFIIYYIRLASSSDYLLNSWLFGSIHIEDIIG